MADSAPVDLTLANADNLNKYKDAAAISEKVLKEVSGWCTEGANIVELCERGDKLLEEEIAKVYKGKKGTKLTSTTTPHISNLTADYAPVI